jgi:trimethylamine--corrinoid protein Co-methyltransferase
MSNEGRGGGRKARAGRSSGAIPQLPWRGVINAYAPLEILNGEQLQSLHRTSMRILSELGIKVMSEKVMDLFEQAGAIVDRGRTHHPRG